MGWDGPLTHRQFFVWQQWLSDQFEKPSRTDFYLMQVAAEVRKLFNKNPASVDINNMKLKWKEQNEEGKDVGVDKPVNEEQRKKRIEMIKQVWLSRMTAPVIMQNEAGEKIGEFVPPNARQNKLKEHAQRVADERKRRTLSEANSGRFQVPPGVRRGKKKDGG